MGKYQVSVVIHRPVEEVFGFVADVENVSRWTGFGEVYVTSDGPMRVGTTTKQVTYFLGRRFEAEGRVTEFEPGERVVSTIIWRSVRFEGGATFKAVQGGTQVDSYGDLSMGGALKLVEPIAVRLLHRFQRKELTNLKNILEARD